MVLCDHASDSDPPVNDCHEVEELLLFQARRVRGNGYAS